jgi:hypothetical protein
MKCKHEWATKKENPLLCPKCKSIYWQISENTEVFMNTNIVCPVCHKKEVSSFLNLARHMVLSDRPNGIHQQWLQEFLNLPFEKYAFGKDKAIAMRLRAYWVKYKSWPQFNVM